MSHPYLTTQIVWNASVHLGIGYAQNGGKVYVVARYQPAGNVAGKYSSQVMKPSDLTDKYQDNCNGKLMVVVMVTMMVVIMVVVIMVVVMMVVVIMVVVMMMVVMMVVVMMVVVMVMMMVVIMVVVMMMVVMMVVVMMVVVMMMVVMMMVVMMVVVMMVMMTVMMMVVMMMVVMVMMMMVVAVVIMLVVVITFVPIKHDFSTTGIDGVYSSWSDPGQCTRSCGGGVRLLTKYCNNPKPSAEGSRGVV